MIQINYSKHARVRMIERGISEVEIERAITRGRKSIQNNKIIASYSYFEVVYKKLNDTLYIITVKLRW